MERPTAQDFRHLKVRNWLLALLRFSITLDPADETTVMAIGEELDRLGFMATKPKFSFFARTTTEICNALADRELGGRKDILRRHLARIDDPRLRRAFSAVADLEALEVERPQERDRRETLLRSVQKQASRVTVRR